jgi:hypothetical protein
MKRFYLSKLIILVALLTGWNMGANAQSTTYSTPGVYTYTVGPGVTSISVDMAGGGGGTSNCSGVGGNGGRVQCQVAVVPGSLLNVYVGGQGANYVCCGGTNAGGFNGGGTGYQYGGGGGGASGIRVAPYALANRLVVAAGGGGAGYNWCNEIGGAGGGLSGTVGVPYSGAPTSYSGQPGTQVCCAGGATYSGSSSPGSLGQGGGVSSGYGGGGGGGGYYGGGSGDNYTPGGGGSSYLTDPTVSGAVTTTGYQAGNGYVTITGPTLFVNPTSLNFGPQTTGTLSVPQYIQVNGVNLTSSPISVTAPTGYLISTNGTSWGSSATITFTPPTLAPTNLYVQFAPGFSIAYCSGVVTFNGGAAPTVTVPVCGTGVSACSSLPAAGTAIVTPTAGGPSTVFTVRYSRLLLLQAWQGIPNSVCSLPALHQELRHLRLLPQLLAARD